MAIKGNLPCRRHAIYSLDPAAEETLTEQLESNLRLAIANGSYRPGEGELMGALPTPPGLPTCLSTSPAIRKPSRTARVRRKRPSRFRRAASFLNLCLRQSDEIRIARVVYVPVD